MAQEKNKRANRLLGLYRKMTLIRQAEQKLGDLFAQNQIPGFIHLSIGQEAVAAGVSEAIEAGDSFSTTHRGHGHAIANGVDLVRFMKEILGREGGLCGGVSGSMHVADMSIGMLGANGIVGGGIPIALGSAIAHKHQGQGRMAVAFFGDGALAEGALHESFNLASLWNLPILFVCENNGWSEFSPTEKQFRAPFTGLANVFGIEAVRVSGDSVLDVADAAVKLGARIRKGRGPAALECVTHRHRGHFEGDPQKYRDPAELAELRKHDPLFLCTETLSGAGIAQARIDEMDKAAADEVEAALAAALAAALPAVSAVLPSVYAEMPHA